MAFNQYFQEVCNLEKETEKLAGLILNAKHSGWWWPLENLCIATERPVFLQKDDQGRLHCETRAAIEYPDGWGVFSWHGTRIDPSWILDKKNLKPETVLKTANLEQRRAGCEILGWANILQELKAKSIQKDSDPQIGELLEVDLPESGKEKFLKVQCGTGRTFAIPVPPDMKTALQANAWTYGLKDFEYKPEIRT